MRLTTRHHVSTSRLLFAAIMLAFGWMPASAQFSWNYGGAQNDAAWGSVLPMTNALVTVGSSRSFGTTEDVYVVKTALNGAVMWAQTYDIGGTDIGRQIQHTFDGGFIITGSTQNLNHCCSRDDLFLMKIDGSGGVVWVKTFGGRKIEEGWDVREINGTNDLVAVGRSGSFGAGGFDGYIIRTTSAGNLIWGRVYGGANEDWFNGTCITNDGNIVAVGASNSAVVNGLDVYAIKVTTLNGTPMWANRYTSPGNVTDLAWKVRELTFTGNNLAIVGHTFGFGGSSDGLILQLTPAGAFVTSHVIRGAVGGMGWDELHSIDEVRGPFGTCALGNIVVAGRMFNPNNGFGNYDMYIGEFTTGAGMPTVWQSIHGGPGVDEGYGVGVVSGTAASPCFTVAAAGRTNGSFTSSFGLDDLYMVRADRNTGNTVCAFRVPVTSDLSPVLNTFAVNYCYSAVELECDATSDSVTNYNGRDICPLPPTPAGILSADPAESEMRLAARENVVELNRSNEPGAAPVLRRMAARAPADLMLLTSFPNPVVSGVPVNLELRQALAGSVTITVTDMAGQVIYTAERALAAGTNSIAVNTDGWTEGSYLVNVAMNGTSDTRRLVVTGK